MVVNIREAETADEVAYQKNAHFDPIRAASVAETALLVAQTRIHRTSHDVVAAVAVAAGLFSRNGSSSPSFANAATLSRGPVGLADVETIAEGVVAVAAPVVFADVAAAVYAAPPVTVAVEAVAFAVDVEKPVW
jgi:hypothetical protein